MKILRTMRGILGTAIAWAIPWALLGGAFIATVQFIALPASAVPSVSLLRWTGGIFLLGAQLSAIAGAIAGATFAVTLALRGRRWTFAQLSAARMLVLGAIGGAVAGAVPMLVISISSASTSLTLLPFVGFTALLGSGSALSMLQLARRSPDALSAASNPRLERPAAARLPTP